MFVYEKQLPTPKELIDETPLSRELTTIKQERDMEIKRVFDGEDDRLILIIGPCSADHQPTVLKYLSMLAELQDEVKEHFLMIPRIYTNKPRTKGKGYKGIGTHPDPLKDADLITGLKAIRNLHIAAFKETYMSAADEMLYPENLPYLEDILGYHAVGARSVENQEHRHVASGIDIPIGMKNPTSGNIEIMLDAIEAANAGHVFSYRGHQTRTDGAKLVHAILRGARDIHGNSIPNYHSDDIGRVIEQYKKRENIGDAKIIIDVNHENSGKRYDMQPRIAKEILWQMSEYPKIRKAVKGLMIESYMIDGSQIVNNGDPYILGKSVTDGCMGFDMTKRTIYGLAEMKSGLTKL